MATIAEQLAAKRIADQQPVNQYAAAPPAPAAPPATVKGVADAVQPSGLAQTTEPAAGLQAAAPTPAATIAQQQAPKAPAAPPAPPTMQAPVIPSTQRGSTWQGSGPDPRDATYYADIAKLNSDTNIGEAQLDLETGQHQYAHDVGAYNLAHQHDLDTIGTRVANARAGLGTSTQGGNQIGELEWKFAQSNAANDADLTNWLNSAALSRAALEAGYTTGEAAELAAAVFRRAQMDALLPPAGGGGGGGAPASNATNPVFKTGGAGPPGPNYVWDASRSQWVNSGPPPGPGYQFDPAGRRWVKTGSSPGKGYHWDFARNRWVK